jgi:hypothetical protein
MFVQVITGRTSDPDGFRRRNEAWTQEVRPGAVGYLGGTAGVADDGRFVIVARFEDEAAARANSARPEQSAFWEATQPLVDGEATFRESSDVSLLFDGGSDAAGFVQVMEGTAKDRAKAEAMETPALLEQLRAARPDLLGSVRVWFPGDSFVDVAYFTSEEDARRGETSSDFEGPGEELAALFGEMRFTDLRAPLFSS